MTDFLDAYDGDWTDDDFACVAGFDDVETYRRANAEAVAA